MDERTRGIRLLGRERIWVQEMVRLEHLLMEGVHLDGRSSMETSFGSRKGQWCSNVNAHAGGVEVACLALVERIGTARSWCIVARRLVCKQGECKRIGIQERGCESPWLVRTPRRRFRIVIFEVVVIGKLPINSINT